MVKHCRAVGATVMLEWPRFCDYWQEKKVSELLAYMQFKFTDFDGCMYGLVAKNKTDESVPIRKPWRIAYIISQIGSYLHKCAMVLTNMFRAVDRMHCKRKATLLSFAMLSGDH